MLFQILEDTEAGERYVELFLICMKGGPYTLVCHETISAIIVNSVVGFEKANKIFFW